MRPGVWGPFFIIFFFIFYLIYLAEAAASAASMQFTALNACHKNNLRIEDGMSRCHHPAEYTLTGGMITNGKRVFSG